MKKSVLILGSLIFAVVLISCQAKDEKIVRPGNTTDNGAVNAMNNIELHQLLALSLDRAVESVHLLKSVLNPEYAALYNIEIQSVTGEKSVIANNIANRIDVSDLKIISNKDVNSNANLPASKKFNLNLSIKRLLTNEDGVVEQFVAVKEGDEDTKNAGLRIDKNKKTSDFTATAQTESISIVKIDDGVYRVQLSRVDDTSSKKDKNSLIVSKIAFDLQWSGKVIDLDQVLKINLKMISTDRKGDKRGQFKAAAIGNGELLLKLSECSSLEGTLELGFRQPDQKGKKAPDLVKAVEISDSSVTISADKFYSPAIECGNRPVVDLTRML